MARRRRIWLAVVPLLLAACESSDPSAPLRLPFRFVEADFQREVGSESPGTASLPNATIRDETRFVLASHPSALLANRRSLSVPRAGPSL